MKRVSIFLLAVVLNFFLIRYGWSNNQFTFIQYITTPKEVQPYPPCSQIIHYKIDQVDPEFKLSKEEFTQDASAAAQVWNTAEGRTLFVYDPDGKLSINLIYDGRQKLSSQINQLQSSIADQRKRIDPQEISYQKEVADYNQKAADLKAEIDSWNAKGGASQEVADQLNTRRDELQKIADHLNIEAKTLNDLSSGFNQQVGSLNKTVTAFNSELSEKPEEGVYRSGPLLIEIYFNNGKQEMIHTLAHELGHAIGMNHVDDKKSIMYSSTNQTVKPNALDLAELKTTCQDDVARPIN